jgi:GntR family phosphonate transport system transcriptional regulator
MPRTAIWTSIADALTADIGAGRYGPGDKLPTEAELSARFGVNRHTVRRALAALADDGIVHSRRGSGVFVTHSPTDYPIGRRVRFHRSLQAAGKIPDRDIQLLETRAADAREAEALQLDEGAPVHVCEGVSLADGHPLALFRSVFPAERLPGLPEALRRTGSVTRALADCGVADYLRVSTRIAARPATAAQAHKLRMPEGAPILRTVGLNACPQGRPVEFGTAWFAADRVTLTVAGP